MEQLKHNWNTTEQYLKTLTNEELQSYTCTTDASTGFSYCVRHGQQKAQVISFFYGCVSICYSCLNKDVQIFASDKERQLELAKEKRKHGMDRKQIGAFITRMHQGFDPKGFCPMFLQVIRLLQKNLANDFAETQHVTEDEMKIIRKLTDLKGYLTDIMFDEFYNLFSEYIKIFRKDVFVMTTHLTNMFLGLELVNSTSSTAQIQRLQDENNIERRFYKVTKMFSLSVVNVLYLPFLAEMHWLLFKIDMNEYEITVYDSNYDSETNFADYPCDVISLIQEACKKSGAEHDLNVKLSEYNPFQQDTWNCGYYVVHHLLREVFNKDIFKTETDDFVPVFTRAFIYYQLLFDTFPFPNVQL